MQIKKCLALVLMLSTWLPASRLAAQNIPQAPTQREIAITIDDLPVVSYTPVTGPEVRELTTKLLATLTDQKIPAVGFVNENKLYRPGQVDDRIHALNQWLDAGFELGNHTYRHSSLNSVTLSAWEDDVIRGESVINILLAQHKMNLRYFRHPYLQTGRDLKTRRDAEAFLVARGYQIAPVTMDAWDWMFAGPYSDARKRGDAALQKQLLDAYLAFTNQVFDYYEKLSKNLVGYEPRQILLIHGNWLEADHIGDLLDVLRKRGYKFIPLGEALDDPAYGMADEYTGAEGTSWIDHWAITRGQPPKDSPACPQWVVDRSKALPRNAPDSSPF